MHIDWPTLATVAIVAAAAALTVVMLVAFALVALSAPSERQVDHSSGRGTDTRSDTRSDTPPRVNTVIAALCLLAAGSIVCYGLYLIIA
jgi:hypothetical protein